jgi:hypothetical protein
MAEQASNNFTAWAGDINTYKPKEYRYPINCTPHAVKVLRKSAVGKDGIDESQDVMTLETQMVLHCNEKPKELHSSFKSWEIEVYHNVEYTRLPFPDEWLNDRDHPGIIVSTIAAEFIPENYLGPVYVPYTGQGTHRVNGVIQYVPGLVLKRDRK